MGALVAVCAAALLGKWVHNTALLGKWVHNTGVTSRAQLSARPYRHMIEVVHPTYWEACVSLWLVPACVRHPARLTGYRTLFVCLAESAVLIMCSIRINNSFTHLGGLTGV